MIGDILSPTHLLFVLVVALLVLGPKRLPEAGRALGKGIRDFRSAISGEEDQHNTITAAKSPTAEPPTTGAAPATTGVAAATTGQHEPPASDFSAPERPSETVHPLG